MAGRVRSFVLVLAYGARICFGDDDRQAGVH